MRYAVPLLLLLGGCTLFSPLSSDEREKIARLEKSARYHYESGDLAQALTVIERGLAIDPDHYKLRVLQGAVLLRSAPAARKRDQRQIDLAIASFERAYATRAPNRHDPDLLYFYGMALQRKARHALGEAHLLTRRGEPDSADRIRALQREADGYFDRAEALFDVLLDRGELMHLAHYQLMLAAYDRGRTDEFLAHAEKYLPLLAKGQEACRDEIQRTDSPGWEEDRKRRLQELLQDEIEVRSLLASFHYERGEYAAALPMLDRVLDIDPRRSADYYNRGRILLKLGRTDEAKRDFSKFLATTDLPPTSEKAILAARTIEK